MNISWLFIGTNT